jgi:hypothetical protein
MDPVRPKRPFRIGVTRGSTHEFKPLATVGVSADGGIFLAPPPIGNYGWSYGLTRYFGAQDRAWDLSHVHTDMAPKLHYHRSGIVSVTLTGKELERRRMRFPPLSEIRQAQVLSIVAYRTWDLKSSAGRKGDFHIVHPYWPDAVAVSFSLIKSKGAEMFRAAQDGAGGLIRGDDSRFVVDFSYFRPDTYLIGHVSVRARVEEPQPAPSIALAAVSWSPAQRPEDRRAFALYSDSIASPGVWEDSEQPTAAELRRLMAIGDVLEGSIKEHQKRIFGV